MKKLMLVMMLVVLALNSKAFAETLSIGDTLKKIPALKQGVAYSLADSKFNYLSTIEIASYKNFTLEAGYAGKAENTGNKAVVVISYPLVKLSKWVTLPVLNLIEFNPGIYVGYGHIDLTEGVGNGSNEFDYGISASLINIKW